MLKTLKNLKFIPFLQEVKYQNKLNSFCRIPYFYFKTRIKTTLPTKFIYENGRLLASSLYNKASPFLLSLSTKFNEITGYDEILALKEKVLKADLDFSSSREAFKEAQLQYNKVIQERNTCQQDINSLLQRKQMWGEKEVKFFTELCQKEYHLQELKEKLDGQYKSSEALVEARLNELMSVFRERYHQEQLWSDKIRSLSTYGTLLVMGINFVILLLTAVTFEPRKRKKLIKELENVLDQKYNETDFYNNVSVYLKSFQQELAQIKSSLNNLNPNTDESHQENHISQEPRDESLIKTYEKFFSPTKILLTSATFALSCLGFYFINR